MAELLKRGISMGEKISLERTNPEALSRSAKMVLPVISLS
jgi:hypothetical protein